VTIGDARDYRDALLAAGRDPTTTNRALLGLALLCDAHGRRNDTPFRRIDSVEIMEQAPQALRRTEWNAVRCGRTRKQLSVRDAGVTQHLLYHHLWLIKHSTLAYKRAVE
jgi:hypothetical protein